MSAGFRARLARLEQRREPGLAFVDMTIDGEHTLADLGRAQASGQRVIVLEDERDCRGDGAIRISPRPITYL